MNMSWGGDIGSTAGHVRPVKNFMYSTWCPAVNCLSVSGLPDLPLVHSGKVSLQGYKYRLSPQQ